MHFWARGKCSAMDVRGGIEIPPEAETAEPPPPAAKAETGRMICDVMVVPRGRKNDIRAERPARPKMEEADDDESSIFIKNQEYF